MKEGFPVIAIENDKGNGFYNNLRGTILNMNKEEVIIKTSGEELNLSMKLFVAKWYPAFGKKINVEYPLTLRDRLVDYLLPIVIEDSYIQIGDQELVDHPVIYGLQPINSIYEHNNVLLVRNKGSKSTRPRKCDDGRMTSKMHHHQPNRLELDIIFRRHDH
eukprot:TRINITY_DN4417_c0_g5_i2.p2 TRINITY_DN4417_c0_g5~~TRINITY_DN4417_c0_g5_i2.p2  ORF type:complete len:161 (+),score=22.04 TRINITY_DN4417_c0_g5_i2:542-1024(+)